MDVVRGRGGVRGLQGVRTQDRWIIAAIFSMAAFQVVQGVRTVPHLSAYERSLWYVNYRFGFVRRGLPGELLDEVLGHAPSRSVVDVVQWVIVALCAMTVLTVLALLCRRRTSVGLALAAIIASSPFVLDYITSQRRPDLLGFCVLGLAGLVIVYRPSLSTWVGLTAAVLLAIVTLAAESAALVVGPWLVLVVSAGTRLSGASRRRHYGVAFLTAAPWVVALAVLAARGRATDGTVANLERLAPASLRNRGDQAVFSFLGDTLAESIDRVADARGSILRSLVAGFILVGLSLWCARAGLRHVRPWIEWALPGTLLAAAWLIGTLACAGALFLLGFDWMRWIASIALSALLAGALIFLATDRSDASILPTEAAGGSPAERVLTVASAPMLVTIAVGVYLATLAPVRDFFLSTGRTVDFFLNLG